MSDLQLEITEMQSADQREVVNLISAAMNDKEGRWAKQTFDFHFNCQQQGTDSTRSFYVALTDDTIVGIVGLHQYRWGPEENVWLSWFAVKPDYQGRGVGKWLLGEIRQAARQKGYRKIFIETYLNDTFQRAIDFYQRQGFHQVGSIERFLPDNSNMLVFMQELDSHVEGQPD